MACSFDAYRKTDMLRKLKEHRLILGMVLSLLASMVSLIGFQQTVSAWCTGGNENSGYDTRCGRENYATLKDRYGDTPRGLSYPDFVKRVEQCRNGDATGIDQDSDDSCKNAVLDCYNKAFDAKMCENKDLLATMASCNYGKGVTDSFTGDQCNAFATAQGKHIQSLKTAAQDRAKKYCTSDPEKPEGSDQIKACEDSIKNSKCKVPSGGAGQAGPSKMYSDTEAEYTAYKKCLEDTVISSAKDGSECRGRGGYWDSSKSKCIMNRADLASENDCTASGGGMTKDINGKITGKDGNKYRCDDKALTDALNKCETSKDVQACKDGVLGADCDTKYKNDSVKLASCNEGRSAAPVKDDPNKKDGTGTGERAKTAGEAGTCGKARTNLIVCDGEGMQALAGVLRIAIFVLTVIVGIAATGGIAYSAVLYAGAQDNAGNTQKAKELIRNIVIGLIAYGFMIAIITWLVPGMNIKS